MVNFSNIRCLGPHFCCRGSPLGPHRVPLGPHFLFLSFRTREKSVQPPSNVDYLITCSPNLKLFTASPPSKTLSWKQCKWQHILEKVSFREKFQLKQSVKGSDFAAVHILLCQAILLYDFPSPRLTSAFTNPSPPQRLP